MRRADSDTAADRFRFYEIAGAPHAAKIVGCNSDGSSFPMASFVRAALRDLFRWARTTSAANGARIELEIDDPDNPVAQAAVDQFGNARGGVPAPFLDVPLARSEAHSTPGPVCALAGREAPLPYEVLANRYGDLQNYLAEFTVSLDKIIAAGFLLEDDRAEILAAQTAKAKAAFA